MIDRLVAGRPYNPKTLLGPGDDAAVVAASDGRVVVSTDMLVESRHFRLDWSTPHDVGRKAIAQNAADIEAMGATAIGFVVAFGAPADTPATTVDELADGMWEEARRVGADIVGGDLVSSPQWVVSVTALGDFRPCGGNAQRRDAWLGGRDPRELGWSAAGYALWDNNVRGFDHCDAATWCPNRRTVKGWSQPTPVPAR